MQPSNPIVPITFRPALKSSCLLVLFVDVVVYLFDLFCFVVCLVSFFLSHIVDFF